MEGPEELAWIWRVRLLWIQRRLSSIAACSKTTTWILNPYSASETKRWFDPTLRSETS